MSWQQNHGYYFPYQTKNREGSHAPFRINERCFIRKEHECGKVYGASKSCFIACPTDENLEPMLELMSEKLMKVGIEPIIAVKERAYGQDIFCTKICGKIIESRFCLVILDDTVLKEQNIPNPNIYYEYGLMTSLRKHIIPLQKEGLELAFNIQSYDTIKYNSRNIGTELDRAFKDATRITESKEKEDRQIEISEKTILRKFELAGLELRDSDWFLHDAISDTTFNGFGQYEKRFYVYVGKIDEEDDFQSYLEDANVVIYRTERKYEELKTKLQALKKNKEELKDQITKLEEEHKEVRPRIGYSQTVIIREIESVESSISDSESKIELMGKIFIAFLINPKLNYEAFNKRAEEMLSEYNRYYLSIGTLNDAIKFEDIEINLKSLNF